MNKPSVRSVAKGPALDEEQVAEFLSAHPDYFERHAHLLAYLQLPHRRGAAVSLVERQVLVLRERNESLEQKLHELLENGRANDVTLDRTHRLARRLLRATGTTNLLAAIGAGLREDFAAARWIMLITDERLRGLGDEAHGSLRVVPRGSPELKPFESFFESGRPRSGVIRDAQREYLFGDDSVPVGSAVLIPLGEQASLGLLAIASQDTERFLPTMSTDYLLRIGELVTDALNTQLA